MVDYKFLRVLKEREIGSSIRFEDIDTEIGTCFPIQVVALVAFSSSVGTHIDSKSKMATKYQSSN